MLGPYDERQPLVMRLSQELSEGIFDTLPLALGVAAYGFAFGIFAAQAGMTELQTGFMGAFVFAGSSQLIAVERFVGGAGAWAAILAGLSLNLRIFLMTASMQAIFKGKPIWKILLGLHLTADENWALWHAKRAIGKNVGYDYFLGSGLCIFLAWVLATLMGVMLVQIMPSVRALGLDFAFTAAFIFILRNMWSPQTDLLPWILSGSCTAIIILCGIMDPSWALIIGALIGALMAGFRHHE